jgi:hypothetical protein
MESEVSIVRFVNPDKGPSNDPSARLSQVRLGHLQTQSGILFILLTGDKEIEVRYCMPERSGKGSSTKLASIAKDVRLSKASEEGRVDVRPVPTMEKDLSHCRPPISLGNGAGFTGMVLIYLE